MQITREVVYDSILTRRKKGLHRQIGDTIEELYRNNINEHSAVLVHHFMKGGDYQKASKYSRLAGRKAEKTGSLNDAIGYRKKRIACLERLPGLDDVQKKIIDARNVLGLYYIQTNYQWREIERGAREFIAFLEEIKDGLYNSDGRLDEDLLIKRVQKDPQWTFQAGNRTVESIGLSPMALSVPEKPNIACVSTQEASVNPV